MKKIEKAIAKILLNESLTEPEAKETFDEIMTGNAEHKDIVRFLAALRAKGETIDEISGAAKVMREKAVRVRVAGGELEEITVLDTCGTGGTGKAVFNVSTAAAFVVAACGVKVAKHGNRAVSGRCGSADVLERLGVKIDVEAAMVERCINEIGVGFMFAPKFHSAMKHAMPARKEIGKRTIFNILGPLSNPAFATCHVMGVFDPALTEIIAEVLGKLGVKHAYVVHGSDGLDEVTTTGPTKVSEFKSGVTRTYEVTPADFGIEESELDDIAAGTAEKNAEIVKAVLSGKKGPCRDMVLINASMGLMAADKVVSFKSGVEAARAVIDSGMAKAKLEGLIELTNSGEI